MAYGIGRRRFIQTGLVSLAAGSSGLLVSQVVSASSHIQLQQFYKVLYDDSFSATEGFAQQARRVGQQVQAVDEDITSLWFDDLYHHWKNNSRPKPIAGITTQSAAYCLEVLAQNTGLKMVFKAVHQPDNSGEVFLHKVSGHDLSAEPVATGKDNWAANIYLLAANYKATLNQVSPVLYAPGLSANQDESLVSWVIAAAERKV